MIEWKYNPEDYGRIKTVDPGRYRVRIEEAEESQSKASGKQMIRMKLKVSGQPGVVWHYMVFNPENPEQTNNNLGAIFDSFGITPGNFNLFDWRGKVGAAEITNRTDQQGNLQANVRYFIRRDRQDELPSWQENAGGKIEADMISFDAAPF